MRAILPILLLATCVSCHHAPPQTDEQRAQEREQSSKQDEKKMAAAKLRALMDHDTATIGLLSTERALRH